MNTKIIYTLIFATGLMGFASSAVAQYGYGIGGPTNINVTLAIKADGSCRVTMESIASRAMTEQMLKMQERFGGGDGDEDAVPTAPGEPGDTKPLTDDQLVAKLRDAQDAQDAENRPGQHKADFSFPSKDTLKTIETDDYASLAEMLGGGLEVLPGSPKFEKDPDGHLRMTVATGMRAASMERFMKSERAALKASGSHSEFHLMLPGKVISSTFPNIQGQGTSFTLDSKDDKSLDAYLAMIKTNIVVVAELGGLVIDKPIDYRSARLATADKGSDIPITDAGRGFTAEAQQVTTTTVYQFPDAKKKDEEGMFEGFNPYGGGEGVRVMAKLFAAKGRTVISASMPRVLAASDDKDRSLVVTNKDEDEDTPDMENVGTFSNGGERTGSTQIELALALPAPDAEAIKEISAESVVTTAGSWKELTLTNVVPGTNTPVDLSALLPGATLVVQKLKTQGNNNLTAQVELRGPLAVHQIEVKIKVASSDPDEGGSNSDSSETSYRAKNGAAVRKLQLNAYNFRATGPFAAFSTNSVTLQISVPQDLKRERVKFKLSGLDLF